MPALYLLYESAHGYALLEAYGLDAIGGSSVDGVQKSVTELDRFGKVRRGEGGRAHASGVWGGRGRLRVGCTRARHARCCWAHDRH